MSESVTHPDVAAIVAVIDAEVHAVARGDIEAYQALLADDAVFMPPNGPARTGAELVSWLREFVEGFAVEWLAFDHEDTAVRADLGYHAYSYSWQVTPRAGGEPSVSHGKGLHILRRSADGTWKIIREIWNSTPVPSSP